MHPFDIELLSDCMEFSLYHSKKAGRANSKSLSKTGATKFVVFAKVLRLQHAILVVGMFSLFESLLQSHTGWKNPFKQLNKYLIVHKYEELARLFDNYYLAVNVLKHGKGKSYKELLKRTSELKFKIKPKDDFWFDGEGDATEPGILVDVDDTFISHCVEIIRQIFLIINSDSKMQIY